MPFFSKSSLTNNFFFICDITNKLAYVDVMDVLICGPFIDNIDMFSMGHYGS